MSNATETETKKKYSLIVRGKAVLHWDEIEFLREGLATLSAGRNTYIRYNEGGIKEYTNEN